MKHKISIIIPILNEAENICDLLNHLLKNVFRENISEIIIVDGGSTDGSQVIIESFISNIEKPKENSALPDYIKLITSTKGRAKQMNFGAKNASGSILYFLHADSFPPKHFDNLIIRQVKKNNEAGCFIMKFNSKHWWLKLAGQLTRLPLKVCRGGDQSQFITKTLFQAIGGYNEDFAIYEDNDLIAKLFTRNQFVVIQKWLTTSSRCYNKHGVWKLQYHYLNIHLKKFFGASAADLNHYYLKHVDVKK
jgi:rSAM/selenodomain-associated transferase 2